jgi:UDP-N-acetylmuramate--alanine ligase
VAVFQPHLYSRTAALHTEFGRALARADAVAVLDVYAARERAEDYPGIDGRLIAAATADAAPGKEVAWLPRFDDVRRFLALSLRRREMCLMMGAGDIDALAHSLISG